MVLDDEHRNSGGVQVNVVGHCRQYGEIALWVKLKRDGEPEYGPKTWPAFHRHVTTKKDGEFFTQGQAQTRTLYPSLKRAVDLGIFFKNSYVVFRPDSNPGVRHVNTDILSLLIDRCGDPNLALLCELQSIGNEIS